MVAICGDIIANPVSRDDVCANCSRLFRHLIPDDLEEFSSSLRHIVDNMKIVYGSPADEHIVPVSEREPTRNLQALYGPDVLPDDLLLLLNFRVGEIAHVCSAEADEARARRDMFRALSKHMLLIEERPIVTRFWLFSQCVFALLRMRLCGLPESIWTLRHTRP